MNTNPEISKPTNLEILQIHLPNVEIPARSLEGR
jgi:hypothetical protein